MFLVNDQRNKNGWRLTWESILKNAKSFITFPGIVFYKCDEDGCRLDHTGGRNYKEMLNVQKPHIVSYTVDVLLDDDNPYGVFDRQDNQ